MNNSTIPSEGGNPLEIERTAGEPYGDARSESILTVPSVGQTAIYSIPLNSVKNPVSRLISCITMGFGNRKCYTALRCDGAEERSPDVRCSTNESLCGVFND